MKYSFIAATEQKISQIISQNVQGLTLPAIKALFKQGEIKLNGAKRKADAIAEAGDEITIFIPAKYLSIEKPAIIYSDENIVVVDKPPNMDVENNLLGIIRKEFSLARAVHRLDRNTRGLVILALNGEAEQELLRAFKNRLLAKYYYALVKGRFDKEGEKTAYLKKDSIGGYVKISDNPAPDYKKIISAFRLVESDGDTSLVEVRLITGRTHQIRAHLAHIGFPVLGDNKYGEPCKEYRHQQLTAYKIIIDGLNAPLDYLNKKIFILN